MSGLIIFEVDGFLGLKIFLFMAKCFFVPSLNVAIETNLGFIPFLILCHDIEK